VGDDFDRDFSRAAAVAFEEIGDRVGHVAAERFEGFALDVQAVEIGGLDAPDASLVIMGGFDDGDAHPLLPFATGAR
jgi:hypothetical protein